MPDPNRAAANTGPDIEVRRAGVHDIGGAAFLFDAYRRFYQAPPDLAASHAFLAARVAGGESVVLLAFPRDAEGAGAAGFTQLYHSFSSVALGAIVILNDLFVAPEWRRFGVARALVAGAAAYARQAGAIRLELATQRTNHPALGLYRSLGFVPDTEFTHLSKALTPSA